MVFKVSDLKVRRNLDLNNFNRQTQFLRMHPLITSHQNLKIKNIITLEKARERKRQNVFIIEGLKELSLAVQGEYKINSVFFE